MKSALKNKLKFNRPDFDTISKEWKSIVQIHVFGAWRAQIGLLDAYGVKVGSSV